VDTPALAHDDRASGASLSGSRTTHRSPAEEVNATLLGFLADTTASLESAA
jgi:hypothetical protein